MLVRTIHSTGNNMYNKQDVAKHIERILNGFIDEQTDTGTFYDNMTAEYTTGNTIIVTVNEDTKDKQTFVVHVRDGAKG